MSYLEVALTALDRNQRKVAQTPPESSFLCSKCPWCRENPWSHYPSYPAWCGWHFTYLVADNLQCPGWRKGEIQHPDLMKSPGSDAFDLANDRERANTENSFPHQQVTCFQCHHFKPNDGPNPQQGWGWCQKRRGGRYGMATACGAIVVLGPGEVRH
jgi:hypothetical protein